MRLPIFLLFFFISAGNFSSFGQSNSNITIPAISKDLHELDYDVALHIRRSTEEKTYDKIFDLLKSYEPTAKIDLTRNEAGEIIKLKFEFRGASCSSDDFGSLVVLIKDDEVQSCGIGR